MSNSAVCQCQDVGCLCLQKVIEETCRQYLGRRYPHMIEDAIQQVLTKILGISKENPGNIQNKFAYGRVAATWTSFNIARDERRAKLRVSSCLEGVESSDKGDLARLTVARLEAQSALDQLKK